MSTLKAKNNDEVFVVMDMFGGAPGLVIDAAAPRTGVPRHNLDNPELPFEDVLDSMVDDVPHPEARGRADPAPQPADYSCPPWVFSNCRTAAC